MRREQQAVSPLRPADLRRNRELARSLTLSIAGRARKRARSATTIMRHCQASRPTSMATLKNLVGPESLCKLRRSHCAQR